MNASLIIKQDPNHTLSYPTLPQPIPCPTFTTPTHILLYSTLPCILYTTHIYTLYTIYSTLPYLTVPYTFPTYSTSNTIIPPYLPCMPYPFSFLHILYPIIYPTLPYSTHSILYLTYIFNRTLPIPNPNTNTYLNLPYPAHSPPYLLRPYPTTYCRNSDCGTKKPPRSTQQRQRRNRANKAIDYSVANRPTVRDLTPVFAS